jgi:3-isopropylmalate dehydrogenase
MHSKSPSSEFLSYSTAYQTKAKKVLGILPGEGVGPELTSLCREILNVLEEQAHCQIEIRTGGPIGLQALQESGSELSTEVVGFCRDIFQENGAVLAGPGGGRFVYDLRQKMDLFYKMNPLMYFPELSGATRLKFNQDSKLDLLVVRDNGGGLYHGKAHIEDGGKSVRHEFSYTEGGVMKVLQRAVQAAMKRQKKLSVIAKTGGIPEISRLWFECAEKAVAGTDVELCRMDIDFAVYRFMARPEEFDVIAVPNCFGDILADLGGIFMASRGNTFGASFNDQGHGVYQTNHGSAHDLVGKNSANPAGQLLSLAMLLRESFGLSSEASWIEASIRQTWREGWVSADIAQPGCTSIGTRQLGDLILGNLRKLINEARPLENTLTAR